MQNTSHEAGELAAWVGVLATKPDNLSCSLEPTWQKRITDPHRWSSDLNTHAIVHAYTHIN